MMRFKRVLRALAPLAVLAAFACGNTVQTIEAPASVVAAPVGNGAVSVSWSAVTGATSYLVYYGTSSGIGTTAGTYTGQVTSYTTSATVSGLTTGTTYYFIVVPVSSNGAGPQSAAVSATVSAVVYIPFTVSQGASAGTAVVSWSAVTGATAYNIYYSQGTDLGTGGTGWPPVSPPATSATITGLTTGQTYYFTVTASVPSTSSTVVAP